MLYQIFDGSLLSRDCVPRFQIRHETAAYSATISYIAEMSKSPENRKNLNLLKDLKIDGEWFIDGNILKTRNYRGEGSALDHIRGVIGYFLKAATEEDRKFIVGVGNNVEVK